MYINSKVPSILRMYVFTIHKCYMCGTVATESLSEDSDEEGYVINSIDHDQNPAQYLHGKKLHGCFKFILIINLMFGIFYFPVIVLIRILCIIPALLFSQNLSPIILINVLLS